MPEIPVDAPGPVRMGEELDAEGVAAALERHVPGFSGPIEIEQFPSGHSNLTYLVRGGGREIVLRRPPFGYEAIRAGHDMAREFRVLDALEGLYARAPRPLFYCGAEESPLGVPFYAMERVRGVVLRPGRRAAPDASLAVPLARAFVENLAELHAVDASNPRVAALGRPEGYVRRQVEGWVDRYRRARTDDVADMDRLAGWLAASQPAGTGTSLLHNDYKYDNLVLDPDDLTRIVAVLDWEMATVGDPLADLGTTLAYWVEPNDPEPLRALAFVAAAPEGAPTREELADLYSEASGRDAGEVLFYYLLGVFKVAVIGQQIYARFAAGLTSDRRFARMIDAVRALSRAGVRALESGRISPGA